MHPKSGSDKLPYVDSGLSFSSQNAKCKPIKEPALDPQIKILLELILKVQECGGVHVRQLIIRC